MELQSRAKKCNSCATKKIEQLNENENVLPNLKLFYKFATI